MPRLLLLIPTLDQSGAEKQLSLLAAHLPRPEFDVRVVALTRGGPYVETLQAAGVHVEVLDKRFKFDPLVFWRLRKLIRTWQPDIVHSWLFAANSYLRLVLGAKQRPKVVVSERCVDSWKSRWQLWLDKKLIPRTNAWVANSQSVADFYTQLGVPPEKMSVIPNAVPIPPVDQTHRAELRKMLGLPPDAPVVGYTGRLARQKRVQDLIWSFALLQITHPDARFLVVGQGPERAALVQMAEGVNSASAMQFLGHRQNATELLTTLDLFWLGSDFEGQSNSLMEAMAAGLPVIASDIPPNRELVTHEVTGLLVPPGDRPGFARAAERLITHPDLAHQLGQAARAMMQAEHSVAGMVAAYAEVYRRLL